jgi:hypothetical protein
VQLLCTGWCSVRICHTHDVAVNHLSVNAIWCKLSLQLGLQGQLVHKHINMAGRTPLVQLAHTSLNLGRPLLLPAVRRGHQEQANAWLLGAVRDPSPVCCKQTSLPVKAVALHGRPLLQAYLAQGSPAAGARPHDVAPAGITPQHTLQLQLQLLLLLLLSSLLQLFWSPVCCAVLLLLVAWGSAGAVVRTRRVDGCAGMAVLGMLIW